MRNMFWVFVYLDFGFVGFCLFFRMDSPSRLLEMQGEKQKDSFCFAVEFCFAKHVGNWEVCTLLFVSIKK